MSLDLDHSHNLSDKEVTSEQRLLTLSFQIKMYKDHLKGDDGAVADC